MGQILIPESFIKKNLLKYLTGIPNIHKNQILSDNLYNDAKSSSLTLVHKLSLLIYN